MKHPLLACAVTLLLGLYPGLAALADPPRWEPRSAEGRTADALEATAHAHLDQSPPDLRQAALWLQAAAQAGSGTAMAHLAHLYQQGLGVEPDAEQAMIWYGRAVQAGEIQHTLTLGWAYLRGQPVARDREQSEAWFRQGIEANYHPARIALASVLIADASGGRAPERALEAESLLKDALDHEPMLASYFLARLYLEGIGHVSRDPTRGAHYTRMGAEGGNPQMQGWLGRMYANGEGVDPDPAEALKWASLAASGGDPYGNRLRLQLEASVDAETTVEGRRRAVEWASRPGH